MHGQIASLLLPDADLVTLGIVFFGKVS